MSILRTHVRDGRTMLRVVALGAICEVKGDESVEAAPYRVEFGNRVLEKLEKRDR